MRLTVFPPPETPVLWRVSSFGRQHVAAGQRYWWANGPRQPVGRVVAQMTRTGRIFYRDEQSDHPVGPGDLMLFSYGEPTAYGQPDRPLAQAYTCQWVCFDGVGLPEHVQLFRQRFGSVRSLGTRHRLFAELDDLIQLARPEAATPPTHAAAAVHRFLMNLFEDAEQQRIQQLSPVQRAIDFIVRQPHMVLSVESLAQRFGCSREHLSRLFREQAGQSAHAYLNEAKTQRALRLLRHTDLTLNEVAAQAGFPSTKTMTRHVHRVTGQTAGRLR